MSYLGDHFKLNRDPFGGYSNATAMALAYGLTAGFVFPFRAGLVLLLRRRLYPTVSAWRFAGMARVNTATVTNWASWPHENDSAFQYAVCKVLGNGFMSEITEPVRMDFDGSGARIVPALPMFPVNVVATAIAGGKFVVSWEYDPFGQGAVPTDFQVFEGTTPSLAYGSPLTDSVTGLNVVAYSPLRRVYSFTTAAFGDGTTHYFGVRARSSAAVAEKNTFATPAAVARSVGPAAAAPIGILMR